jgi:hypothetical protein
MNSVEEKLQDEAEARLSKAEREAHSRFMRVRANVNDGAVTSAAEKLWTEAGAALREHQTTKNGPG